MHQRLGSSSLHNPLAPVPCRIEGITKKIPIYRKQAASRGEDRTCIACELQVRDRSSWRGRAAIKESKASDRALAC